MAKDYSDTKIEYKKDFDGGFPLYHFKVYSDVTEFAKISGHRFVSMVNSQNIFANDLQILLGFIKRQPPVVSDYIEAGNILEQPVIDLATEVYSCKDVETFSFEDLENGTDDFHFIRDFEYTDENGERVTGEIKTFSNKKKVKWNGKQPIVNLDWWLQTRLEVEILKDVGGNGRVFFYYVPSTMRNAVVKGRPYHLKLKDFYASEYIEKYPWGAPEPMVEHHFGDEGFSSFKDLMEYALERREEMMTRYEDEKGEFYYVTASPRYPWFNKFDHVKNFIDEVSEYIETKEVDEL